nr:hypothetical protein [Nonomuraea ceibae]
MAPPTHLPELKCRIASVMPSSGKSTSASMNTRYWPTGTGAAVAGSADAACRLGDDACSEVGGDLGGSVGAGVVHDDHFAVQAAGLLPVCEGGAHGGHVVRQVFLLVERGDHHR